MRFTQPAYPTVHFSEEIWVKCPNCNDLGLVSTPLGRFNIPKPTGYTSRFSCIHCGCEKRDRSDWQGLWQGTMSQACGHCGTSLHTITAPTKSPINEALIKCHVCSHERQYELRWYRFTKDQPCDPFFGLELWLQTTVKSNTLWLYNLNHLNYLRDYVIATLREDDGRHKYSLITNLPQWIKAAKNRNEIVKKLDKLEREFSSKLKKSNVHP